MLIFYIPIFFLTLFGSSTIQLACAGFNFAECEKTKNCVLGNCLSQTDLSTCEYLFSFVKDENNKVLMELYTKRSSPKIQYIAVGFSKDQEMGDDAVTHCAVGKDGKPEIHLSINTPGKNNNPVDTNAEHGNLELEESEATDDHLYCKFRQTSHADSKDLEKPNLSKPYYILLARGPTANAMVLTAHSFDPSSKDFPFVSNQMFNVFDVSKLTKREQQNQQEAPGSNQQPSSQNQPQVQNQPRQPQVSSGSKLTLIDVHGILMIIAWIILVAVAVYSARYMRSVWATKTIMGLKIWFHIHRTLNFTAVCLIVLSVVLVFVKIGQWEGPWFGRSSDVNTSAGAWHSLFGLLAVFLAVIQPFGALFRCGIDNPKRFIFNWAHRSAGLLAYTFAAVALFIAVTKFTRHFKFPVVAFWVLVGFFICVAAIIAMSEVLRLTEVRQQTVIQSIEMKNRNRGSEPSPSDNYYYQTQRHNQEKLSTSRKILFTFISVTCVAAGLILVLLILFQ